MMMMMEEKRVQRKRVAVMMVLLVVSEVKRGCRVRLDSRERDQRMLGSGRGSDQLKHSHIP